MHKLECSSTLEVSMEVAPIAELALIAYAGACRKERPVSRHPVDQDERAIDDHERNPAPPSSSRTGQPTGCLKSACSSNFASIAQLTVDALSTAVLTVG